jgi:IS30 family transposase
VSRSTVFTAEQVEQLWTVRATGLPVSRVAAKVGIKGLAAHKYFERCGGIRPRPKTRAPDRLTLADREEISRGLASGLSLRSVAAGLTPPRPSSTVSREVARNGGRDRYRAVPADQAAWERARRPKTAVLLARPRLRAVVEAKLETEQWSPQQIAAWLPIEFPADLEMRVSHETIYLSLFVQARGALRRELHQQLRSGRLMRRSRARNPESRLGHIPGLVSISERPPEAEDRAVPGHWEGDLVYGTASDQIATLVERHSRFLMLVKLPTTKADEVAGALATKIRELPEALWLSLTWDRGGEMRSHAAFTVDTGIQVYFADPRSPWQRGSNENTNGLLRQYFPKGKSVADITQDQLDDVARKLNTRPRKTLGWLTPSQALEQAMR